MKFPTAPKLFPNRDSSDDDAHDIRVSNDPQKNLRSADPHAPSSTVSAVPTAPPKASVEERGKAKVRDEKEKELYNCFLGEISKLQTLYQREALEYVEQIKKGRKDVETERNNFNKFFQSWIDEEDLHLHELISVSKTQAETKSSRDEQERVLRPLIDRVIQHYEDYYITKTISGKQDVLSVLSPSWTSTLEDAFLWIGGWRPSMAFHLLYSKFGLQMESKLAEIIRGLGTVNESIGLEHEVEALRVQLVAANTYAERYKTSTLQAKEAYLTIRAEVEELEKKLDDLQEEQERRTLGELRRESPEDALVRFWRCGIFW
ncbi:hypothetical protein IFM89_004989 [Coptis chinensis]|uniref:DOG1 domain-containing protein n=1 Tax=Coptis chinensis TaxID=261450 RepID=A0A835LQG1_9MAGN|nr:hypothetical protein IFM89_004989 [Coptis chinensis]